MINPGIQTMELLIWSILMSSSIYRDKKPSAFRTTFWFEGLFNITEH